MVTKNDTFRVTEELELRRKLEEKKQKRLLNLRICYVRKIRLTDGTILKMDLWKDGHGELKQIRLPEDFTKNLPGSIELLPPKYKNIVQRSYDKYLPGA